MTQYKERHPVGRYAIIIQWESDSPGEVQWDVESFAYPDKRGICDTREAALAAAGEAVNGLLTGDEADIAAARKALATLLVKETSHHMTQELEDLRLVAKIASACDVSLEATKTLLRVDNLSTEEPVWIPVVNLLPVLDDTLRATLGRWVTEALERERKAP